MQIICMILVYCTYKLIQKHKNLPGTLYEKSNTYLIVLYICGFPIFVLTLSGMNLEDIGRIVSILV
jgi:hypothetical protein